MITRITQVVLLHVTCHQLHAQQYITAAGIRLASNPGLSLQQHLWGRYTAEAMMQQGILNRQTRFTFLLEQHHKLLYKGLDLYLGAGPHIGWYKPISILKSSNSTKTMGGLSLVGGAELAVQRWLVSVDYKPSLSAGAGLHIFQSEAAISARYILVPSKKKSKALFPFSKKYSNRL